MKRLSVYILFAAAAPALFAAGEANEDFGGRFERYLSYFSSFSPRLEATVGESGARDFILKECESMKMKPEVRDFSDFDGGFSYSRNIEARIPGARPDTIVLAVPLVHEPGTAPKDDGSVNLALALAIASEYAGKLPPLTLRFLFLGGETGSPTSGFLGTRLFLQDFFPDAPQAVFYLNFRSVPAEVGLGTGARGTVSPAWIVERLRSASVASRFPISVSGNAIQVHRLAVPGPSTAVGEYLRAGYPAVSFEGTGSCPDRPSVWASGFLALFREFIEKDPGGFPEEWDRHYLVFGNRNGFFIVEETVLIAVLLSVLAFSILYALVFRIHARKYLLSFLRHFWNLPILFGINFVFLLAGTLFTEAVSGFRGSPDLWTHHPFLFFVSKVSVAVFFSSASFHLLRRLPISRSGSFYSSAAIFVFLLDVFIFSFINLSFCYYFLWAYLAALLFSRVKNRAIKAFVLIAASVWLAVVLYDTFSAPEIELARILILSRIHGNLLLAFIILPFFLLAIRLDLLVRHPVKGKSGYAFKGLIAAAFLASAILGAFGLVFDPYRNSPQPLSVVETVDLDAGTRVVRLSSPSPLGNFEFMFGGASYAVSTKDRHYSFTPDVSPPSKTVRVRSSRFLDRKSYELTILPVPETREISLALSSEKDILLYDSDLPYSVDISGRKAVIHAGRNPPSPLVFSLTVPADMEPKADLAFVSSKLSRDLVLLGKSFKPSTTLVARTSFRLKSDG